MHDFVALVRVCSFLCFWMRCAMAGLHDSAAALQVAADGVELMTTWLLITELECCWVWGLDEA